MMELHGFKAVARLFHGIRDLNRSIQRHGSGKLFHLTKAVMKEMLYHVT